MVYNDGEIELKVSAEVFDKNKSVISRHINNIFNDKEVDEKSNKFQTMGKFTMLKTNL